LLKIKGYNCPLLDSKAQALKGWVVLQFNINDEFLLEETRLIVLVVLERAYVVIIRRVIMIVWKYILYDIFWCFF
jgi:hypothetical protein